MVCLFRAHMDESRHTWMSHGTHESDVSHVNESCHIWMSHVKFERSHVADEMHQSCSLTNCTYGRVMAHLNELLIICIWLSLGTHESVVSHMNESCPARMSHATYEWVVSHMDESCHTWMSHITGHASRRTRRWIVRVNSYKLVRGSRNKGFGYLAMRDMTYSCVGHDSSTCVTWLIHMCAMTHVSIGMTHSYVWRDHMCDMKRSRVSRDPFTCMA